MTSRTRIDLDSKLAEKLRKKADEADISLRDALMIAVQDLVALDTPVLKARVRVRRRPAHPWWWALLCRELRKHMERGEPITTRKGSENTVVQVRERLGFVVLESKRSQTGKTRRITVKQIENPRGSHLAIRQRLRQMVTELATE